MTVCHASRGGVFIALYDEETLQLYLKEGLYATLMRPWTPQSSRQSKHFAALADFCTIRPGAEIFFFLKRKIYYGGRVESGLRESGVNHPKFILNGDASKWGIWGKTPLVWDESKRQRYKATSDSGHFLISTSDGDVRHQPYLIKFTPCAELVGRWIKSDELYWAVARKKTYPMPSNSMQGMSFCTLSPGEVNIALGLLRESKKAIDLDHDEGSACLTGTPFDQAEFKGVGLPKSLRDAFDHAFNENEIECFLLANPTLFSQFVPLASSDVLARQVPVCPFKSGGMDRTDIAIYSASDPRYEMTPRAIIEVKRNVDNGGGFKQLAKYLEWLAIVEGRDFARSVDALLVAPGLTPRAMPPFEWPNIRFAALE